jgi:hypothetical protein
VEQSIVGWYRTGKRGPDARASSHNRGYEVSLERLKIYVALADAKVARTGFPRIIDEFGEDYLYPSRLFVAAEIPVSTRRAVLASGA